jgi:hypothetical protein
LGVFLFGPSVLPDYKYRMLGILSALLGGLFGYFLTGQIVSTAKHKTPGGGQIAVRATGGVAAAGMLLLWWSYGPSSIQTSSAAATQLQQQLQQAVDTAKTSPAPAAPSLGAPAPPSPVGQPAPPRRSVTLSPSVQKLAGDLAASDPKYKSVAVLQNKRAIPIETLTRVNTSLLAAQTKKP